MMYMAVYPEVQENIFEEIRDAVEKNGDSDNLSYEDIASLTYLEQAIHEIMRYSIYLKYLTFKVGITL